MFLKSENEKFFEMLYMHFKHMYDLKLEKTNHSQKFKLYPFCYIMPLEVSFKWLGRSVSM